MKFAVDFSKKTLDKKITYYLDEHSMVTKPSCNWVSFELSINKLTLSVLDNRINYVGGYFPSGDWIDSPIIPPRVRGGALITLEEVNESYSLRLRKEEWPVYCNYETRWVCVGEPTANGEAVEFLTDCIGVVNDEQQLAAVWMRLDVIPILHRSLKNRIQIYQQKSSYEIRD